MLQRQDRHEEILLSHTDILREQAKAMNRLLESVSELRGEFRELNQILKGEVLGRIERLEAEVFKKGS